MSGQEILQLLRESGALLTGHFELSSGLHSPQYLQCAVALQHAALAERLGTALAARCRSTLATAATVVVSPALGGIIIGHEVGRALGVRACFTERSGGTMSLRRGFDLEAGETVLLVEDVITTGRSTRETRQVVIAAGGEPAAVACIANRSGSRLLDELPLTALVNLDIPHFAPSSCPQCAAGEPLSKPGSRPG
ncbi:MAG: orotate phosphoribosyltransferase [Acidobacteriota bacterium]